MPTLPPPPPSSATRSPTPAQHARWFTTRHAARHLDMSEDALRRMLERNARRGEDGAVVAEFDGLRARMLRRRWRIAFSDAWLLDTKP